MIINLIILFKHLKKMSIQRQIDKLAKQYKNKKIVLYGAGLFSINLFDNYDLSKFNIVAIADISYKDEELNIFYGIKCISLNELRDFDCDVIMISAYDALSVFHFLKTKLLICTKNSKTKIQILIKPSYMDYINYLKKRLKIFIKQLPNLFKKSKSYYKISGNNNQIIVKSNGIKYNIPPKSVIKDLNINITGDNNIIEMEGSSKFSNSWILIEKCNNSKIIIGKNTMLKNFQVLIKRGNEQKLSIDDYTSSENVKIELGGDKAEVIIGKDCMISYNVHIRTDDSHSIIDKNTGQILNRQKNPLVIGNHCWIGQDSRITKNAQLPDNTIVGLKSVVSKKFTEEYTIIAGVPAQVIKRDVNWNRKYIYQLEKDS